MAKKSATSIRPAPADANQPKQTKAVTPPSEQKGFLFSVSTGVKLAIVVILLAAIAAQSYLQTRAHTVRFHRLGKYYDSHPSAWNGVWTMSQVLSEASQVFNANVTRIYSMTAKPITSTSALEPEVIALADDEVFFWPAVRVGHTAHPVLDGRTLNITTLSASPRVFVIDNFLSNAEADHLVKRAKHDLKMWDSKVGDSAETSYFDSVRTSSQVWIGPSNAGSMDDVSRRIKARVLELTGLPDYCEDIQVVHYDPNEHYYPHHDAIDRTSVAPGQRAHKYYHSGGNRVVTVLFYLNDVEEGGETRFPMTGAKYHPRMTGPEVCDPKFECLSVKPRKGSAVMFYNLLEEKHMAGVIDPMSLHTGCDVIKGEKFAANQWIRNKMVDGILW